MEESGEQIFDDDSNAERSGIVIDIQPSDKDKVYGSTSVRLHASSKISGSVYGGNHYHHQLFECGQYDTCFLSFFCYCIASSCNLQKTCFTHSFLYVFIVISIVVARRLDIYPCYPRCFGVLPMAVRFRTLNGIEEDFCL